MKLPEDLAKAIATGSLEEIQNILAENPEYIGSVDEDERGVLHGAVLTRNHAVLRWLLEQPACPFLAADEGGWNALHLAASIGDGESTMQLLCHADAARLVNAKNETGNGPLHYASSKGHVEVVRMLIEAGADVMLENRFGQTALHRASTAGHAGIARELIEACPARLRANFVDGGDREGDTALHVAVQDGREDVVSVLLEAGARRDLKNAAGATAM